MDGAKMKKTKTNHCQTEIPEDLIFNILKTLPAKSLMRFKAMCKAWHALIRDPYFAESHCTHSQTRPDASYLPFHYSFDQAICPTDFEWRNYSFDLTIFPTNLDGVFSTQLPVQASDDSDRSVRGWACTNIVNGLISLWEKRRPRLHRLQLLNLTTGEKIALPVGEKMSHEGASN